LFLTCANANRGVATAPARMPENVRRVIFMGIPPCRKLVAAI
jgi:hypothetical protein